MAATIIPFEKAATAARAISYAAARMGASAEATHTAISRAMAALRAGSSAAWAVAQGRKYLRSHTPHVSRQRAP